MKLKNVVGPLAITSVWLHENTFDAAYLKIHASIEETDLSPEQRQEVSDLALLKSVQQYQALLFLKLSDPARFGPALVELKNHNLISHLQ